MIVCANNLKRPPPLSPSVAGEATQICRLLQSATAAAFGVPLEEIRASSRRAAEVAFARQSAMYLAHVALGLSYSAVGVLFHRDRTTAAYACRLVEDRRDDPTIDRLLQRLEALCDEFACASATQPQVCA
jgi:chromosomal replication initiation ATPase DnaA